ncbi:MAG: GNAT family N-acetyltransferase, partial [Hominenteromicrobium sp.]
RPAYQNRGFGSQLLRFALEKAKTLHCGKIALGMVHDNVPLRSWYEKQGFETVSLKKFEKVSYTVGTMEYRLCGCGRND